MAAALEAAASVVRWTREALDQATRRRDALIAEAVSRGWTHQQIAHVTGLDQRRVGHIARQTRM